MPFTPYHFGPSGLVALLLRIWLDVPVFILANVFADTGYLFAIILTPIGLFDFYYKIYGVGHTLLGGAAAGFMWAIVMYLAKPILIWFMKLLKLPYKPSFIKIILSAVLGIWLHILIDGVYHGTILPPLSNVFSRAWMDLFLALCFVAFVTFYMFIIKSKAGSKQSPAQQEE